MIDMRTVELTHHFCRQYLAQHGYRSLYLIGSRARGNAKPNSDHDFVAIVGDDAPSNVLTGSNPQLLFNFCKFVSQQGLGKVDLLIATKSRVAMKNPTLDDLVPYSCQQHGKVVWDHAWPTVSTSREH